MKQFSSKIMAAYLLILPAVYTMLVLVIYQLSGAEGLLSITPLKSLFPTIIVLLLMPTIAFMLNTSYRSYVRAKGQRLLGTLIVSVWIFNVVLLIGACTNS